MGGDYVYVDEKTLREYFRKYVKDALGKGYEISAAVMLKGFFEIESGQSCVIGFKIKQKYLKFYQSRTGQMTVEEVKDLIEKHKDEDDLVDVSISPVATFRGDKNSAWVIQLKRFGHYQKEKDTKGLISVIEQIKKKYTPTSTILVFLFDGHKGISPKEISEYFKSEKLPFSRVMFINPNKDNKDKWFISIGELWPNYGYNKYKAHELVKNFNQL